MRNRKAYTVHWPDGSVADYVIYAPTASKARAEVFSNVSDAWSLTFKKFLELRVSIRRAPERDVQLPDRHELTATLSEEQLHVVTHSYGGTNCSAGYRDYFFTSANDSVLNACAEFGLFTKQPTAPSTNWPEGSAYFYLTDLGKAVAAGEMRLYPTWMEPHP